MTTLVIGEAIIDAIVHVDGCANEKCGGSPANVAVGLSRLGENTRLLTSFGGDDRGGALRRWLKKDGVEVQSAMSAKTSVAYVNVNLTGAPDYDFDIKWDLADAAADFTGPSADFEGVKCVHSGSLATLLEPGASQVEAILKNLRSRGILVTYDPNIRLIPGLVPAEVKSRVQRLIALSDVVKCSNEEIEFLAGRTDLSADDLVEFARELMLRSRQDEGEGPQLFVVTMGKDGAFALNTDLEQATVPAQDSGRIADTVGAGDSFMSALIYQTLRLNLQPQRPGSDTSQTTRTLSVEQMAEILTFCSRVAGITVTRWGANPPYLHELDA